MNELKSVIHNHVTEYDNSKEFFSASLYKLRTTNSSNNYSGMFQTQKFISPKHNHKKPPKINSLGSKMEMHGGHNCCFTVHCFNIWRNPKCFYQHYIPNVFLLSFKYILGHVIVNDMQTPPSTIPPKVAKFSFCPKRCAMFWNVGKTNFPIFYYYYYISFMMLPAYWLIRIESLLWLKSLYSIPFF